MNLVVHKSTGPITFQGKEKSGPNAIKHGLFVTGVIPQRESKTEYLKTAVDMTAALQPVVTMVAARRSATFWGL